MEIRIFKFEPHSQIEAYPEPIIYWERESDRQHNLIIQSDSSKNLITTQSLTTSTYEFNSTLKINNVDGSDYGDYYCVSKNIMGIRRLKFSLCDSKDSCSKASYNPTDAGVTPEVEGYGEM